MAAALGASQRVCKIHFAKQKTGGRKSYGLSPFVDLLCAGMSMGAWSRDTFVKNDGARIAQFFGAMRTDLFGKPAEIEAHVETILEGVRNSAKAAGHDRIYIHGSAVFYAEVSSAASSAAPKAPASCALGRM